jgi:hypothetical protein
MLGSLDIFGTIHLRKHHARPLVYLEFHTHHYMNKRLEEYCFCYDYGYLEMEEGRCLVVKRKDGIH